MDEVSKIIIIFMASCPVQFAWIRQQSMDVPMFCYYLIPLFHWDFGSSFTRKQGLFPLVTYGRLLFHSQMNLICLCWLLGQCLTCLAWSDEVKTVKTSNEGLLIPLFHRELLFIVHSSEARFISSDHPQKTIVQQSDESVLCLSTIRSVSGMSGVIWWGESVRWRN